MVNVERLPPRLHATALDLRDLFEGVHQGNRTRRRAALHPHDRGVLLADRTEVDHERVVSIRLLERHGLQQFDGFRPTLAAVRDVEPVHGRTVAVEVLRVADRRVLRGVEVGVRVSEDDADGRHVIPVRDHHVIVVAATDAGAVEQEVEERERRGRCRAVREHFLRAVKLVSVALLEVAARHQDSALGDEVGKLVALGFLVVVHVLQTEQRGVPGGDAIRDLSPVLPLGVWLVAALRGGGVERDIEAARVVQGDKPLAEVRIGGM